MILTSIYLNCYSLRTSGFQTGEVSMISVLAENPRRMAKSAVATLQFAQGNGALLFGEHY